MPGISPMPRAPRPRPARPRRRKMSHNLRRAALLGAPAALIAGLCAGAVLSGAVPVRGSGQGFTAAALALTAKLGVAAGGIEAECRATTDTATILAALNARAGTPILAL